MEVRGYKIKPRANLRGASLSKAGLGWADLREATLIGADLERADLRDANLRGADLSWSDLREANLSWSDLRGADLRGANLRGANLRRARLPFFQIPQEGSLVVFKKVKGGTVKLLIPETAKRTATLVGRKCRAEFALVLEGRGYSMHLSSFEYHPGQTVTPNKYDGDIRVECTHGIHFFLTREEAERY
jgi:hypothetical protein